MFQAIYRVFQKKCQNVCLFNFSKTNEQISKSFFFFWKLGTICKFWIQNHFFAILGGWDICKYKPGSEIYKYIFTLAWGGPHSIRVALRCPDWPLSGQGTPWDTSLGNWGPWGPLRVWPGQSGASQVISRPLWYCEDHFRSVWICTCLFRNLVFFCKYLSPLQ